MPIENPHRSWNTPAVWILSGLVGSLILYYATRTSDIVKENKTEQKSALENMLGKSHVFNDVIK